MGRKLVILLIKISKSKKWTTEIRGKGERRILLSIGSQQLKVNYKTENMNQNFGKEILKNIELEINTIPHKTIPHVSSEDLKSSSPKWMCCEENLHVTFCKLKLKCIKCLISNFIDYSLKWKYFYLPWAKWHLSLICFADFILVWVFFSRE